MNSEIKRKKDREYSKQWRKENPDKIKSYLERTREIRKEKAKEYAKKNKHKLRESNRNHYEKNRDDRLKKQKEINQKNGYMHEKKPERRKRANVRKQTRRKYPLEGNTCNFCDDKATQHHHTTNPITIDEFIFVCKKHHNKSHGKKCVLVGEGVANG